MLIFSPPSARWRHVDLRPFLSCSVSPAFSIKMKHKCNRVNCSFLSSWRCRDDPGTSHSLSPGHPAGLGSVQARRHLHRGDSHTSVIARPAPAWCLCFVTGTGIPGLRGRDAVVRPECFFPGVRDRLFRLPQSPTQTALATILSFYGVIKFSRQKHVGVCEQSELLFKCSGLKKPSE